MLYLLKDAERQRNVVDHILRLPFEPLHYVDIGEYVPNRTKAQNRLYWKWIPFLASHFGYAKDEMHDELKYAFLGEVEYTNRKGVKRIRPKSTTDLSVQAFTGYLNKLEQLARQNDIKLPYPDDYKYTMGGSQ